MAQPLADYVKLPELEEYKEWFKDFADLYREDGILIMMQSFTGWMTFYAAPWGIPVLVGTGLLCYGLVSAILLRRIRRIPMSEALKDAEM